jgi:tryptophanyl-tRNA synthetase
MLLEDRDLGYSHIQSFKLPIFYCTSTILLLSWSNISATHVPVGEDQSQHLETTRILARQFNKSFPAFKPTFNIPETLIGDPRCKIMLKIDAYPRITSLTNPMKKMSKSDGEKYSKILLTTPPDQIRTIISRALTDSLPGVYASPDRPGVTNLLSILAAFGNKSITEIENEVRDLNMRTFKERIAESIVIALSGIQSRYHQVKEDKLWLERVRKEGNERARQIASQRITEIKRAVGLL